MAYAKDDNVRFTFPQDPETIRYGRISCLNGSGTYDIVIGEYDDGSEDIYDVAEDWILGLSDCDCDGRNCDFFCRKKRTKKD